MSKVVLVANLNPLILPDASHAYIGIDRGALFLMEKNIPMDCAIGDFDSITVDQLKSLRQYTKVIELSAHKMESDGEAAIRYACEHYTEVSITGVIGGRVDHYMAIYNLLAYHDLNFDIFDQNNWIRKVGVGEYPVTMKKKYLSLFALAEAEVTLRGVAYPLEKQRVSPKDIYMVSNEVISDQAYIIVSNGKVMIIESRDANKEAEI